MLKRMVHFAFTEKQTSLQKNFLSFMFCIFTLFHSVTMQTAHSLLSKKNLFIFLLNGVSFSMLDKSGHVAHLNTFL